MMSLIELLSKDRIDWDTIRSTVEHDASSTREKSVSGSLPLHLACEKDPPIDVIKLLLYTYPDSVKEKNNYGYLALYTACTKSAPINVIGLLLDVHPAAIKEKNDDGSLPLHVACNKGLSINVIKLLLDAYPDAVKVKNNNGSLPLHMGASTSVIAKLLLDAYPDAIKEKNNDESLPLHFACGNRAPTDVIAILLNAYPDAIKEKRSDGDLPLHIACGKRAPIDVIKLFIDSYSDAVKEKSKSGYLPLHIAYNNDASADIIRLLLDAYPDAAKIEDGSGYILIERINVKTSEEVIYALVKHDLPIHRGHCYSWTFVLEKFKSNVSLCIYLVKKLFDQYQAQRPEVCRELAYSRDELGRTAISIVHADVRKVINQYLLFMGRFEMKEGPPEHKSNTCIVVLAFDHDNHMKKVALKFMKKRDGFLRELTSRDGVDSRYVLPIEQFFDGSGSAESDRQFLAYLERVEALKDYKYLLVLPASERSLSGMILHEHICGSDWVKIKNIFRDLVLCLNAVHITGKIHGDIKPLNAMRLHDGCMCLIDMDAATAFGDTCGAKISSAYIPPEMIVSTQADAYDISTAVPASVSYDMWGLGVVLYNLCTGETLFQANTDDNLVDASSWQALSSWNNDTKSAKLSKKISDSAARNLVSQLLHKDPTKRPDTNRVWAHPFLTGRPSLRLPGDEPEYDIFLSYRVATDKDLVTAIYDKLTAMNLRVFWDKICLADGKNWEEGFATGLCGSGIFVPLISRGALKSRFESLHADSDVDNVLLEHRLALELYEFDLITHIYPIYVGDVDNSGKYGDYSRSDASPLSPDITVLKLEATAIDHLDRLGLGLPLIPNVTVKGIVDRINKYNGGFVRGEDLDSILSALCDNLAKIVKDKQKIQPVSQLVPLSSTLDDVSILRQQLAQAIKEKELLTTENEEKDNTIRELNSRLALCTVS